MLRNQPSYDDDDDDDDGIGGGCTAVQDGKRIAESPRWKLITQEDHYTLLIYEVRPEDAGKYDCTVSNKHGRTSCSARLNVIGMHWTPKLFLPSFYRAAWNADAV